MPRIPDWCPSVFRFRGKAVAPRALHSIVILLPLLFTFHDSFLTKVYAQGATATLSGTVKDETGAVVPSANISIISVTQGFQRSTTTNGNGSFVVPLLPPGDYEVKAEHEGFAPAQVTGVVLNVNDQKIITVYLKVGKITQTVEIVDASKLI